MSDNLAMEPAAVKVDAVLLTGETVISGRDITTARQPAPIFVSRKEELYTYLEVYRSSASFHLKEYLRFRQLVCENLEICRLTAGDSESDDGQLVVVSKDIILEDDGSAPTEGFWNMKVERDSLVADLDTLEELLREAQSNSMRKPSWMTGMSFLSTLSAVFVGVTHGPVALSYLALPSAIPFLYHFMNLGVIGSCRSLAISTREMVEHDKLENHNRRELKGTRFKLLRWMNR